GIPSRHPSRFFFERSASGSALAYGSAENKCLFLAAASPGSPDRAGVARAWVEIRGPRTVRLFAPAGVEGLPGFSLEDEGRNPEQGRKGSRMGLARIPPSGRSALIDYVPSGRCEKIDF